MYPPPGPFTPVKRFLNSQTSVPLVVQGKYTDCRNLVLTIVEGR